MHTPWSHAFKFLTATSLTAALTACGGGGGSSDTTPDAFSFTALTDVAFASSNESESVTIIDISTDVDVSISGGEYSIDGGAFTSAAGTLTEGQTLTIAVTADSEFSTTSTATITVGDVSASFSVTTLAQDVSPESLVFTDVTDAEFNEVFTSETITITEINDTAAISIAGGEYQINDGGFVTTAATVEEGDTVAVRITSGATVGITTEATVTVGDASDTFSVTTTEDTIAPELDIFFPTASTLTDGSTVTFRGNAMDDFGPITLTFTITTDDGATIVSTENVIPDANATIIDSWSHTITLENENINTIDVVATDSAANESDTLNFTVTQTALSTNYPAANDVALNPPVIQQQVDIDWAQNRLLIPGTDPSYPTLLAVDLATGERSEVLPASAIPDETRRSIAIYADGNKAYLGSGDDVQEIDLATNEVTTVVTNDEFTFVEPLDDIRGINVDAVSGQLYIIDNPSSVSEEIVVVNRRVELALPGDYSTDFTVQSNAYNVFLETDNDGYFAFNHSGFFQGNKIDSNDERTIIFEFRDVSGTEWDDFYIAVDAEEELLWAIDPTIDRLVNLSIDLNNLPTDEMNFITVSDQNLPAGGANTPSTLQAFTIDADTDVAYLVDVDNTPTDTSLSYITSIYLVDLTTGERLVLSRYTGTDL